MKIGKYSVGISSVVVGTVFLAMCAADLKLVHDYGIDCPIWDEFDGLDVVVGRIPLTAAWLWSPHNEHRIPLPRLLYLATMRCTYSSGIAVMLLNCSLLAIATLAILDAVRRARGKTIWTDAVIPVTMLGVGQYETILSPFQVQFAVSALIFAVIFALVLRIASRCESKRPVLVGILGLVLILCGAQGLTMGAAIMVWLVVVGGSRLRSAEPRRFRDALILFAPAAASVPLVLAYLHGLRAGAPGIEPRFDPAASVRCLGEFFSTAFLPRATFSIDGAWFESLFWWSTWAGVVWVLLTATAVLLVRAWWTQSTERLRISGIACCLAMLLTTAVSIGIGRTAFGAGAGTAARYVTLAAPLLVVVYVAFSFYAPRLVCMAVAAGLLAAELLLVVGDVTRLPSGVLGLLRGQCGPLGTVAHAQEFGAARLEAYDTFAARLAGQCPLEELTASDHAFLFPYTRDTFRLIQLMHDNRLGPFRAAPIPLTRQGPLREVDVPIVVDMVDDMTWTGTSGRATDTRPRLVLNLGDARRVLGIRLTFTLSNPQQSVSRMSLFGYQKEMDPVFYDWSPATALWLLDPSSGERTETVWVYDTIDRLRIIPDVRPCDFAISKVVLLLDNASNQRDDLLVDLHALDANLRIEAAETLWKLAPDLRDAVPALAAALNDTNRDVRLNAAGALGEFGLAASPAVARLAHALKDEDADVRDTAAKSLKKLGPTAQPAVAALIEALTDASEFVKCDAAYALAAIGPPAGDAIAPLEQALKEKPAEDVSDAFAEALREIRGPSAKKK